MRMIKGGATGLSGFRVFLGGILCAVLLAQGGPAGASAPGEDKKDRGEAAADGQDGQETKRKLLSYRFGLKGNFTTGYAESNCYVSPFGSVTVNPPFSSFTAGYAWYGNYQVYDTYGSPHVIQFHEPRAGAKLVLEELIPRVGYLDIGVVYRAGLSPRYDFQSQGVTPGINIEVWKFFAELAFDWSVKRYSFINNRAILVYPAVFLAEINEYLPLLNYLSYRSEMVNFQYMTWAATAGFTFNERFSLDVSYEQMSDENNVFSIESRYWKHYFRLGGVAGITKELSLDCGASAGFDSMKYVIAGFDAGFLLKLFSHLRVEGVYRMDYHRSGAKKREYAVELWIMQAVTDPGLQRLMQWVYADSYYSSKTRQKRSSMGASFLSHELSFGVSASF